MAAREEELRKVSVRVENAAEAGFEISIDFPYELTPDETNGLLEVLSALQQRLAPTHQLKARQFKPTGRTIWNFAVRGRGDNVEVYPLVNSHLSTWRDAIHKARSGSLKGRPNLVTALLGDWSRNPLEAEPGAARTFQKAQAHPRESP